MESDFIPHATWMENETLGESVDNQLIFVVCCLLRPEPSSPGQTNGISTPEQLTGRFQVSAAASQEF